VPDNLLKFHGSKLHPAGLPAGARAHSGRSGVVRCRARSGLARCRASLPPPGIVAFMLFNVITPALRLALGLGAARLVVDLLA
jgi:hypothetical protein